MNPVADHATPSTDLPNGAGPGHRTEDPASPNRPDEAPAVAPGPGAVERGAVLAAAVGAAALLAVAWTFRAGPWPALALTLAMTAFYGWGLADLRRYAATTRGLRDGLAASSGVGHGRDVHGSAWWGAWPVAAQPLVRRRAEGERQAAQAPALAPYLTGLLVLLGMLGTFLGMVLTFTGTAQALQAGADVQALRGALAGPVQGLGLAFGTSVGGVAASAMLGLVSALVRRRRAEALQALDRLLAGPLHTHTREHRQQVLQAALAAQADLLPGVALQLQQLMAQLAQQQQAWHSASLGSQQQFHDRAGATLGALAASVESSLQRSLAEGAREGAALLKPAVEQALNGIAAATADWQTRLGGEAQAQLQALHQRFGLTADAVAAQWQAAAAEQQRGTQQTLAALDAASRQTVQALQTAGVDTVGAVRQAAAAALGELTQATGSSTALLQQATARSADAVLQAAQAAQSALQTSAGEAAAGVVQAAQRAADALAVSSRELGDTLRVQATAVVDGLGAAASGLTVGVEQRLQHWLSALAEQQAEQQQTMAAAAAALSEQAGRLQGELGREVSVQLRGLAEGVAGQLDALAGGVGRQLESVADRFAATAQRLSEDGQAAQRHWAAQAQQQSSEQRAALAAFSDRFGAQALDLIGEVGAAQTRWLDAAAEREQARFAAWSEALRGLGDDLRQRWAEAGEQAQRQQQQIAGALADTAARMAADNEAQARRMVDDIAALMAAAAEAPRAAAEVIEGLRAQWAVSAERDQALLAERAQALEGLGVLLGTAADSAAQQQQAVQGLVAAAQAMLEQVGERFAGRVQDTAAGLGDAAALVAAGSVEVASVGDVFAAAVDRFGASSAELIAQLQRIEQALVQAQSRSDEQMAYVVAQAREVVDLTVLQQKQLLDEWQRRGTAAPQAREVAGG